MLKFIYQIILATFSLIMSGCTHDLELPSQSIVRQASLPDQNTTSVKIPGALELGSLREEGVYSLGNEKIYIKTDGRSVLSILDDLAFKKRFNYTILTEMPKTRIKIYNEADSQKPWEDSRGKIFASMGELLIFLENFMNYSSPNANYKISVNHDGIIITKGDSPYSNSYKKVFLFNTTVDDAIANINKFYGKTAEHDGKEPLYSLVPIKAQNALLIRSSKETLSQISEVITSIDSTFTQVMIESQVFEYDDSISRKIGTALEYGRINNDYSYGIKTTLGEGIASTLPSFFNTLNNTAQKQTLLFNLAMQDRDGEVKIVAEPRVVMKPGQEGSIKLNTVKYVITTGVQTSDLKEIPTGINFKITPTILSENTIQLDISLEQSEFIPVQENNIVQSINKNEINTTLIVNDGELISIGGIYLSKETGFNSGIPFLKDIPIVGHLFGSTSTDKNRVMIEFMIKPTIKKLQSSLTQRTKNALDIQLIETNKSTNTSQK